MPCSAPRLNPTHRLMDLWEEEMAAAGEDLFHKREAFVSEPRAGVSGHLPYNQR